MQEMVPLPDDTVIHFPSGTPVSGHEGVLGVNRTFGRLQDRIMHHSDKTGYAVAKQECNIAN